MLLLWKGLHSLLQVGKSSVTTWHSSIPRATGSSLPKGYRTRDPRPGLTQMAPFISPTPCPLETLSACSPIIFLATYTTNQNPHLSSKYFPAACLRSRLCSSQINVLLSLILCLHCTRTTTPRKECIQRSCISLPNSLHCHSYSILMGAKSSQPSSKKPKW